MPRLLLLALAVLCLALAVGASAAAQPVGQTDMPEAPGPKLWLGTGLGVTGLSVAGHWTYATGRHVVTLRSAGNVGLVELLTGNDAVVMDLGLLYGRALYERDRVSVSAGAGLGFAVGSGSREEESRTVLAVPIEVQAGLRLTDWLGAEAYGFGSINAVRSFSGVALGIRLGDLR